MLSLPARGCQAISSRATLTAWMRRCRPGDWLLQCKASWQYAHLCVADDKGVHTLLYRQAAQPSQHLVPSHAPAMPPRSPPRPMLRHALQSQTGPYVAMQGSQKVWPHGSPSGLRGIVGLDLPSCWGLSLLHRISCASVLRKVQLLQLERSISRLCITCWQLLMRAVRLGPSVLGLCVATQGTASELALLQQLDGVGKIGQVSWHPSCNGVLGACSFRLWYGSTCHARGMCPSTVQGS